MILPSVLSLSSAFGYLWAFFVKSEFVKTWVMLWLSSHFYFVLFWYLLAFRLTGNSLAAWLKYTLKAWNQEPNWNFYIISLFLERFLWFQEDWMISWFLTLRLGFSTVLDLASEFPLCCRSLLPTCKYKMSRAQDLFLFPSLFTWGPSISLADGKPEHCRWYWWDPSTLLSLLTTTLVQVLHY